jgi:LysM repeat protein
MSRNTLQPHPHRSLRAGATITALALGITAAGPGAALAAQQYKVRQGDTLASIAQHFGYDGEHAWRRIFNANRKLSNPDLIVPGQRLSVPDKGEKVEPRALPQAAPVASSTVTTAAATATPSATPSAGVWTQLAACESGGNWAANTGNGFYGGLQFSLSSWQAVGGTGYPHEASSATQIAMGQRLQARQGWGAWPGCASSLGLY